ncbi:DUF559 domain-containing protein [Candidatus Gracilibacteria bacterium]|nr:DUF559 domain-containing protein [Candidatus Gracilibacteria bacterium]
MGIIDGEYLNQKGLSFGGRYLPYNKDLKKRARQMRYQMTLAEQKLWDHFLKLYNTRSHFDHIKILRQKIIDHYIVDFYIPQFKLVIEVDGVSHEGKDAEEYDTIRTKVLAGYGITEIRIQNTDIHNNFDSVIHKLQTIFSQFRSPFNKGGGL